MSYKERVRIYTEELILNCIDEVASEAAYFSVAYAVMKEALKIATIVQGVTVFEAHEICASIIDSRLRYQENKGGEFIGI